jgi:nicotinate-nucleotide pyrophosphorylase (carboxylating)
MVSYDLEDFISRSLAEDVGSGDHTTLAIIPPSLNGKAQLFVKEPGIIAGVEIAKEIFSFLDKTSHINILIPDGTFCDGNRNVAFTVEGKASILLQTERLLLNIMQRMSGIATTTHQYVKAVEGTKAKILDTRKTTPGFRYFEKEAVKIGGGYNHRFGLFDMILIKDNHIDYAGSIEAALTRVWKYLETNNLYIPVEVEVRSIEDVKTVLKLGNVQRILIDNFNIDNTKKVVELVNHRIELESSGGIQLENIRDYALCGVDYISVGALTHHIKSLDLSLKATF